MLRLNDIEVRFDQPVLKGIDLNLQPETCLGILGKNGAGKTTLFSTIYGLIKPSNGLVECDLPGSIQENVSLLESEPYFYPYMKGSEYLKLIRPSGEKIDFWNDIFELPLDRYAQNYSTGMKKKLAFIALLLQDRPIWLLDEPFNGVDFESNEKMVQIIKSQKDKKSILISSHILEKLTAVSDCICVLESGIIKQKVNQDSFDMLASMLRQEIDEVLQSKLNPKAS